MTAGPTATCSPCGEQVPLDGARITIHYDEFGEQCEGEMLKQDIQSPDGRCDKIVARRRLDRRYSKRLCKYCGNSGAKPDMLQYSKHCWSHPPCYLEKHGKDSLSVLTFEELSLFSPSVVAEVGVDLPGFMALLQSASLRPADGLLPTRAA